jgi:hypothetical protein
MHLTETVPTPAGATLLVIIGLCLKSRCIAHFFPNRHNVLVPALTDRPFLLSASMIAVG